MKTLLLIAVLLTGGHAFAQTRFYLPNTGAHDKGGAGFTLQASWGETDNADRIETNKHRKNSAMASKAEGKATTANVRQLMRQFLSNPLAAQTIGSGTTVKGTIRVLESGANDNVDKVSVKILVVNDAATSSTGTLLALGDYGPTNEFATSLTNRRIADGDTVAGAVNANAGDRILIELGYNNTTNGTSVSASFNFGDDNASDCGDDETGTTACNPFVELSQTLTFRQPTPRRRMLGGMWLPLLRFFPALEQIVGMATQPAWREVPLRTSRMN